MCVIATLFIIYTCRKEYGAPPTQHLLASTACSGSPICHIEYYIWLLIKLTPKGVVFSFLFFSQHSLVYRFLTTPGTISATHMCRTKARCWTWDPPGAPKTDLGCVAVSLWMGMRTMASAMVPVEAVPFLHLAGSSISAMRPVAVPITHLPSHWPSGSSDSGM